MSHDVGELIARMDRGEALDFVFFWSHRPTADGAISKSCFSQWWKSPFKDESGAGYVCAEQFMMAEKARTFHDAETLALILKEHTPAKIKALGRLVKNFDPAVWNLAKFPAVVKGNLFKFGQNATLREFLLSTGDKVLVEASPKDRIWGIGLAESAAAARNPRQWRGTNLLGFAIMEARDQLRAK